MAKSTFLITGASGYISSWTTKYLLELGHVVHATVRSLENMRKCQHLLDWQKDYPEQLKLFEADLLAPSTFDAAAQGCDYILHMASPFRLKVKDAQKDLVDPAVKGTQALMDVANRCETVKRVVVTSSIASIMGDAKDAQASGGTVSEMQWNTTSSLVHQPYAFSKVEAEKTAWLAAEKQSRWELMTINPGFVLGPSLTTRVDSTSIGFVRDMMLGKMPVIPKLYIGVVDVRDVARAHIQAALNPSAVGRHLTAGEVVPFMSIAKMLKKNFKKYPLPKLEIPKFVFSFVGNIAAGYTAKMTKLNYDISFDIDNSHSKSALGLEYTPIEKTLKDHADQLIRDGLVKAR